MRNSDIFDSFVKIAQEKGLISNDSEKSKKKLEQTGRADSLDITAIEALYGVKPDSPKGSEYKNNIMEAAHPNSVIISPSYDKLNGLVENNIERQNILLRIVNKTPDGQIFNRKYAEKELILSLVRVANDLDNRNHEDLRALADACLVQATNKSLKKNAIAPLVVVVATWAVFAAIYAKGHLKFHSDGFKQDLGKLNEEIKDLLEANTSTQTSLGAGYEYTPEFLQTVNDIKVRVNSFADNYNTVETALQELQKPRDANELIELSQHPRTQEILETYKKFRSQFDNFKIYINKVIANFSSKQYKNQAIAHKGFVASIVDSAEILHGGNALFADDFDDVVHALQTFVDDINDILARLQEDDLKASKIKEKLQQSSEGQEAAKPDVANDNKSIMDYLGKLNPLKF